jgi:hypothetical protein
MTNSQGTRSEPYVLVEGPRWGDAAFYGKWLLAAADANRLFQQALATDPFFKNQIETLLLGRRIDFGACATVFFRALSKGRQSALFPLDSVEAEIVAMMIGMGFFALSGKRLQMVVPPALSIQTVKDALLRFIQTQDDAFLLHPEQLLATMSRCEAQDWQRRLAAMDENHRIADRERALGNFLIPARAELSELSLPALLSMMPKVTNMKNPTEDEVRAEINRQMCFLEREGFLTSSVDSTGKVWWEKTEKWAEGEPDFQN